MSQKVKQQISAFVDGDKDTASAIDKLKQDDELAQTFGRYNLIGDVMRNDVPEQIHLDLASSISDAIDKEPVVLAPNTAFSASVQQEQNEENETKSENKVVSLFRPLAQYGLAASFAAALVVGFQSQPTDTQVIEPALMVVPVAGALDPVSIERTTPAINQAAAIEDQKRRINAYILDHAQQLKHRQDVSKGQETLEQTEASEQ